MAKVGIPRTLAYYTFYPLWKTFLEELGFEVVLSPPTNKKTLDLGVQETVNDACVPIKLYHGHIMALKSKVDYLFIPRLVSADGKSTFCPKFLGLPDMVRFSRNDLPPIIDTTFKVRKFRASIFSFLNTVGKRLSASKASIIRGYLQARKAHKKYHFLLSKGLFPAEAMGKLNSSLGEISFPQSGKEKLTLAVVGYPYSIFDPYISGNLLQNLRKMGIGIITPENISLKNIKKMETRLPQNFFWYYSNRAAWGTLHLMEKSGNIDGIIHVTAFGCGPDAMLNKLLELEDKNHNQLPFLSVSIDEHSGEAGILTRLEAFVDMLAHKKQSEGSREI